MGQWTLIRTKIIKLQAFSHLQNLKLVASLKVTVACETRYRAVMLSVI
jgi:hypothetical protein